MSENIEGINTADGTTRPMRPGDGLLEVMGVEGDTKTVWDPTNEDEVENAEATFDRLKEKGYIAYRVVDEGGTKGEVMTKFNPDAGRMIMAPPLQGG